MKGLGSLYKRGNIWWMTYCRNGRQYRLSTGTDNETKARGVLKQELTKSLSPNFVRPNTRKIMIAELVSDLFAHYDRIGKPVFGKRCRRAWELRLEKFFGNMKAADLWTSTMHAYRDQKTKEGVGFATINIDLQVLRRAYKLASETEPPKVDRVPKFDIRPSKDARKVFISDEQLNALRKAAAVEGLQPRVLIELAYMYGWRKSELRSLRVRDVNLPERYIRLQTSKNGEAREAPITEGLAQLLSPLVIGAKPDALLFSDFATDSAVDWLWFKLCRAIGVSAHKDGLIFHDFRRTSARSKRAAGVSESVVMSLQGWKTAAMFRRYAIVDQADKKDALQRIEAAHA